MSPEFKYGLLSGVGISLWIAAEYALGLHTVHLEIGVYTGYFSLLIPIIALFFLLRKKRSDGHLDLGASVISGLTASFLGALIVYGFNLAYNQWINPDWIDNALALKVATMRAQNVGEIEIRRVITTFRDANSALGLVTRVIVILTALGGIYSALLTVVLRSQSQQHSRR